MNVLKSKSSSSQEGNKESIEAMTKLNRKIIENLQDIDAQDPSRDKIMSSLPVIYEAQRSIKVESIDAYLQ